MDRRTYEAHRLTFVGLALLALLPAALAQTACPFFTAPAGVADHALSVRDRREVFLRVWSLTNDYLYDREVLAKANWAAVRERFAQRAITALNDADFYALLNEMVRIVAPEDDNFVWTKAQAAFYTGGMDAMAGLGFFGRREGNALRVREVMKGAAADLAGLKPGDLITLASGNPCVSFEFLRGEPGGTVSLNVVAANGQTRSLKAERTTVWLPPRHATDRVGPGGSIGYLLLASLEWGDVWQTVESALTDILVSGPIKGLILDVRGLSSFAPGQLGKVLSDFVSGHVGSFVDRRGVQSAVIAGQGALRDRLRDVPIAVLVDEDTYFDGEIIAGILQQQGRAKVVGSKTPGDILLSELFNLPDGGVLGLATKDFVLADGTHLSWRGVIPDVEVPGHWWQFSHVLDPVIVKAIEVLQAR